MKTIRATVQSGRLVVDEATRLPDGTILELVVADEGDELDEAERAELHAALAEAWASAQAGRTRPAEALVRRLSGHG